jgi:Ca2+-binding RTX toxin-like protein
MITLQDSFIIDSLGLAPGGGDPDVAVLEDGRFVVVWTEVLQTPVDGFVDTDGAVFGRIYTTDGKADGDTFQISDWAPGLQSGASIVASSFGFAVSWQSQQIWGTGLVDTDSFLGVFTPDGIIVDVTDLSPDNPGDLQPPPSYVIGLGDGETARVIDGAILELENGDTFEFPGLLTAATRLADGNIAVAGVDGRPYIAILNPDDLNLVPDGIPGVTGPVFFPVIAGSIARDVRVTALTPGTFAPELDRPGFVVTGMQSKASSLSSLVIDVYAPWGERIGGTTISVPLPVADTEGSYDVLALPDGTFMVAWTGADADGTGVLVRHVDADGSTIGSDVFVHASSTGNQSSPSLSLVDDNRVIVVFESVGGPAIDGATGTMQGAILDIDLEGSIVPPTDAGDVLVGTAAGDAIDAMGGDDTVNGRGGDDYIVGSAGIDNLSGGVGNDALRGGDDRDRLSGGDGDDGLNGGTGGDRLEGGAGRDGLHGGDGADRLAGGEGSDRLTGGRGDDTLAGGADADRFVFGAGGGADLVNDFRDGDLLVLDRALWDGSMTRAQVIDEFGAADGEDFVFTFDGGETITLAGVAAEDVDVADLILI